MKRVHRIGLVLLWILLQDATLGQHYQAAFGFRISPIGWVVELRKALGATNSDLPEGFKVGTNYQTVVALPEPTSEPVTPTPIPQPVLNPGAIGYDQPNFNGSSPTMVGQYGGQKFTIIGRAGKAPFPMTCFCLQVALKDDPTQMFWVLRLSIPFADEELNEYILNNEVPDLTPAGASRPTL
jgi:hypothetical protein